jgi:2-polyprenyl-6-methoxyphenol hydroxylase-like FAD-dependent oxidoreductase
MTRALVIGAGVGGLATTVALREKEIDVRLFERGDAVRGFAGSGLTIWTNALSALENIGLAERVAHQGEVIERQEIRTGPHFRPQTVEVGRLGRLAGRPGVGVRREDLLRVLHEACAGIPLRFGARLISVEQDEDGVTAVFADGSREHGDVLIGADGLRSAVRTTVFTDGPPVPLGHMIWRGISEASPGYPESTTLMLLGAAGARSVSWPVGRGRVCWSVSLNGAPARTPLQEHAAVHRMLLNLVADLPGPLAPVIEATPAECVMRTDLHGHRSMAWRSGRVAVVGDASHAMPTVYGQGACQALEDAVELAGSLAESGAVEAGLRRYEQRRAPRMGWLRERVFGLTRYQEWELPVLTALRNDFFGRIPARSTESTWRTLLTAGAVPGQGGAENAG